MKKSNKIKWGIIIFFSLATIGLIVANCVATIKGFWNAGISDCIEIFILIFVSFYLVDRQNDVDRKKEKINGVISKIQDKIVDSNLIVVDSESNKKITRIKLTTISNLLEIIKDDISDQSQIEIIVNDMDSLTTIVMDHIDDEEYIKKSEPQIVRLVTSIEIKLEQIKFDIN